jgi:hypothetical protein
MVKNRKFMTKRFRNNLSKDKEHPDPDYLKKKGESQMNLLFEVSQNTTLSTQLGGVSIPDRANFFFLYYLSTFS